jgi:hypothetical protein
MPPKVVIPISGWRPFWKKRRLIKFTISMVWKSNSYLFYWSEFQRFSSIKQKISAQGRRKLLKVGGGTLEGHLSNKKGHLTFFPRKFWRRRGGGGGRLKKIFRTYQKNFPGISHFFLNMKNFSGYNQKLAEYMIFFPRMKTIFRK